MKEMTAAQTPMYSTSTRRIAPRKFLLAIMLGTAMLVVAAMYLAQMHPWLGLQFAMPEQGEGLTVSRVQAGSPNAEQVAVGTRILALESASGQQLKLDRTLLLEDPDILPYPALERFMQQQDLGIHILLDGPVALTASGQRIALSVITEPWSSLTANFILHTLYALIALVISMSIWVLRPKQAATRYFAISGIAVVINELPLAIYSSRDLFLDGSWFRLLSTINHAGTMLLCASLTALFWAYPRRLTRFPLPLLLFAAAFVCWGLDWLKIGGGARNTIYLPVLISYLLGLIFARAQWKISKNRPTDRAALKWCLLAIFSGTVLLIGLVTIPPVFHLPPLVPLAAGYVGFLMIYLGLAAGLLRYRLFDIERWWFRTWLWFVAGLLVVVMDMTLVYVMRINNVYALTASLAIAGWLYFPMRQWLWSRLGRQLVVSHEGALRLLVNQLLSAKTKAEIHAAWPLLLQRSFTPLRLYAATGPVSKVSVTASGASMAIPPLGASQTGQTMEFPLDGGRLFTPEDARMAELLYDLTRNALESLGAREAGAEAERQRVLRDLHDDLGAKLLSLVYAAESDENRELAQAALQDMHGLVYTAAGKPTALGALCTNCEGEARVRLTQSNIQLHWTNTDLNHCGHQVSARGTANIARMLREATSNIIRHAQGATEVRINWQLQGNQLEVDIVDNGQSPDPQRWKSGHGTRTIRTRANDLNGTAQWTQPPQGGCHLNIRLPLPL